MNRQTVISQADIDAESFEEVIDFGRVAWDIETSGLDWRRDQIGTCQIAYREKVHVVLLNRGDVPERLRKLLQLRDVQKIFHHAPFDLRFMTYQWSVRPHNLGCTKIASKILSPTLAHHEHSLRPVLKRHLGVDISKDEQRSDWLSTTLTDSQVAYAADDVSYLLDLVDALQEEVVRKRKQESLFASWEYLPHRVQLDIAGAGDVFCY